ncbi:MAG: hypothetical protein JO202_09065 [Ktedonobacteraceae bacterium]|nr:hypothetical protein [Ktedonobacteraceae bacterium]
MSEEEERRPSPSSDRQSAYVAASGQLSEEGRLALATHIQREKPLQALACKKEREHGC